MTVLDKEQLNEVRRGHLRSLRTDLEEAMWCSLENDHKGHAISLESMETKLALLWQFDRKLEGAKALEILIEPAREPASK